MACSSYYSNFVELVTNFIIYGQNASWRKLWPPCQFWSACTLTVSHFAWFGQDRNLYNSFWWGKRGLKCLLVVVVESSSHLKKVGSPHSMVWRCAFEPTNGWIFDPDKRNDRMHQVEIRIINRFFENLTAPPCLMGAQSLMTKQRFFILRDPQQIRYLHKKFKTRSGTMIFCCLC